MSSDDEFIEIEDYSNVTEVVKNTMNSPKDIHNAVKVFIENQEAKNNSSSDEEEIVPKPILPKIVFPDDELSDEIEKDFSASSEISDKLSECTSDVDSEISINDIIEAIEEDLVINYEKRGRWTYSEGAARTKLKSSNKEQDRNFSDDDEEIKNRRMRDSVSNIHAETQRLIRETVIELPKHQPVQFRTLGEFRRALKEESDGSVIDIDKIIISDPVESELSEECSLKQTQINTLNILKARIASLQNKKDLPTLKLRGSEQEFIYLTDSSQKTPMTETEKLVARFERHIPQTAVSEFASQIVKGFNKSKEEEYEILSKVKNANGEIELQKQSVHYKTSTQHLYSKALWKAHRTQLQEIMRKRRLDLHENKLAEERRTRGDSGWTIDAALMPNTISKTVDDDDDDEEDEDYAASEESLSEESEPDEDDEDNLKLNKLRKLNSFLDDEAEEDSAFENPKADVNISNSSSDEDDTTSQKGLTISAVSISKPSSINFNRRNSEMDLFHSEITDSTLFSNKTLDASKNASLCGSSTSMNLTTQSDEFNNTPYELFFSQRALNTQSDIMKSTYDESQLSNDKSQNSTLVDHTNHSTLILTQNTTQSLQDFNKNSSSFKQNNCKISNENEELSQISQITHENRRNIFTSEDVSQNQTQEVHDARRLLFQSDCSTQNSQVFQPNLQSSSNLDGDHIIFARHNTFENTQNSMPEISQEFHEIHSKDNFELTKYDFPQPQSEDEDFVDLGFNNSDEESDRNGNINGPLTTRQGRKNSFNSDISLFSSAKSETPFPKLKDESLNISIKDCNIDVLKDNHDAEIHLPVTTTEPSVVENTDIPEFSNSTHDAMILEDKPKKRRVITFSDSDSDSDSNNNDDEDLEDDYEDGESRDDLEESEADEVDVPEDEEEAALLEELRLQHGRGSRTKKASKLKMAEYLEEEAELSGSDDERARYADDDEDIDRETLEAEYKRLEQELINDDDESANSYRRAQLERLHLRLEMDEDQRKLRYLKEMFFEDGDLHNEDARERQRRFRWRGLDKTFDQHTGFSDEEGDDESDTEDRAAFLLQRIENSKKTLERETAPENIIDIDSEKENDDIELRNWSSLMKWSSGIVKKSKNSLSKPRFINVNSQKMLSFHPIPLSVSVNDPKFLSRRGSLLGSTLLPKTQKDEALNTHEQGNRVLNSLGLHKKVGMSCFKRVKVDDSNSSLPDSESNDLVAIPNKHNSFKRPLPFKKSKAIMPTLSKKPRRNSVFSALNN